MGREHDVDRLIAAIVAEGLGDLPAVVERVLRSVLQAVPSYADARRPGDVDDVRIGLRHGIELCFDCILDGRLPDDDDEHAALRSIGAQRARQGITAEDVGTVLDVARRHVLDVLLGRAQHADVSASTALEAARSLAITLDQFTDAIAVPLLEGHAHGLEERFPPGSRRRAVLVDRLLARRWANEDALAAEARDAGRVLGPRSGLLLVVPRDKWAPDGLLDATGAVAAAVDGIEGALRWTPVAHVPVVVSGAAAADWDRALRLVEDAAHAHGVGVVVIEPTTIGALVEAYRETAPRLGRVAAIRPGLGLIPRRRLALVRVLAGDAGASERMAFVRRVIGPVLALPDADAMLEILEACHAGSGRLADVALAVHRHENTVRKRLDRIEALTGLSMHVPAERYEVETAVQLHRILMHELQSLDHREDDE